MATFRTTKTSTGKTRVRVEVCVNRERISKRFDNKAAARAWAAEKELEMSGQGVIQVMRGKYVADVLERYRDEVSPTKAGANKETLRLNFILEHSKLADVTLIDLSVRHIAEFRDWRLKGGDRGPLKGSSVNRDLTILSNAFTVARREWGWLQINPVSDTKRAKEPAHRDRRVGDDEIPALLTAMNYPGIDGEITESRQLAALFWLISLETGLRRGEVCRVRQVDDHGVYIQVVEGKTENATRTVPLTPSARVLFDQRWRATVTTTKNSVSSAFYRACSKTGITGLTFHDSRHEAITNLANKLGILDLTRMTGHSNPKQLLPYYNPTPEEIAERLNGAGKKKG